MAAPMGIRRQRLYYNLIQVNGNFLFYPKQANTARQQCYNNTGIKVLISYKNILLTLDENRKEFLIYIFRHVRNNYDANAWCKSMVSKRIHQTTRQVS